MRGAAVLIFMYFSLATLTDLLSLLTYTILSRASEYPRLFSDLNCLNYRIAYTTSAQLLSLNFECWDSKGNDLQYAQLPFFPLILSL